MRHRTAALLFGAAAAAGAAAIGAATATMYGRRADEKHHQALMALTRAFFSVPWDREPHEEPPGGQRPVLELIKGGLDG